MKENCKKEKENNKRKKKWTERSKTEKSKGNRSSSERERAKRFCCAFSLGFLQLICKVFLIFMSNLEFASSITLKQRELFESKHLAVECKLNESRHVAVECRCLKM